MVILAQYHSNRNDNDRPFDVDADIRVRIITDVERANAVRNLTALWENVSIRALYDTIQLVLDHRENVSKLMLQTSLINNTLMINSNNRFGLTQATTVYDSNAPKCIRITFEINEVD